MLSLAAEYIKSVTQMENHVTWQCYERLLCILSCCTYMVKRKPLLTAGMSDVPILGTPNKGSSQVIHPIVTAYIRSNGSNFLLAGICNIPILGTSNTGSS